MIGARVQQLLVHVFGAVLLSARVQLLGWQHADSGQHTTGFLCLPSGVCVNCAGVGCWRQVWYISGCGCGAAACPPDGGEAGVDVRQQTQPDTQGRT
jgi:hypothetical protein